MLRSALAAALLAAPLIALPASAAPAIQSDMPAIAASVSGDTLRVRLPDGVIGDTRATANRTIMVEGFDADGRSLGVATRVVHKRLTYASIDLSAELVSAARLVVTAGRG